MATNDPVQPTAGPAAGEGPTLTEPAATEPATNGVAAETEAPTLESALHERDDAREEAQRYLGIAQRAQADYQNLKRRAEQQRVEDYDRGRGDLLLAVVPALDDLARAMSTRPEGGPTAEWAEGVQLIARKLENTLAGLGVERIFPAGQPFDPNEHEALLQQPTSDVPPDTVVSVAQPGYRVGGRLVRPAQVVVAKAP